MGNHASSCFLMHSSPKAKLINCKGNLRQFNIPIKAAELMLEEPGHVICPIDELRKSQRIYAMRADDELLAGKVYLLVRVSRVNGKVTKEESAIIEAASDCDYKKTKKKKNSLKRRKRSGSKVLPAVNDESSEEEKESDDQVMILGGNIDTGFSGYRFGKPRHWSPVLESISEVY